MNMHRPALMLAAGLTFFVGCDDTQNTEVRDSTTATDTDTTTSSAFDTTTGHDTVILERCWANRVSDSSGAVAAYGCTENTATGGWDCLCDGQTTAHVTASTCAEALLAQCEVREGENYCDYRGVGLCWIDDGAERHDCVCGDDVVTADVDASCEDSLFLACASECSTARGACTPATDALAYDCTCDGDRTFRSGQDASCENVLRSFCEPECETDKGACFRNADYQSFACRCSAAGSDYEAVRFQDLGHDDGCDALAQQCGAGEVLTDETCTKSSTDGLSEGHCRITPQNSYQCGCEGPTQSSNNAGSNEANRPCIELLQIFCPPAFQ